MCHIQTFKSVRFNKKTPSPVFGIGQRMSYVKLPFVSLKMLVRVVRELGVVSSKLEHDGCGWK